MDKHAYRNRSDKSEELSPSPSPTLHTQATGAVASAVALAVIAAALLMLLLLLLLPWSLLLALLCDVGSVAARAAAGGSALKPPSPSFQR
jgi:hypothetical protein